MAKAWQDFGKKLDDEAKDALLSGGFDYGSYSSDEERIRAALDMLYHLPLWKKARYDDLKRLRNKYAYDEKGVDPFEISNAASIIGSWSDRVGDDGKTKLTQGDQFYNQYWKADKNQREYWKDAIEGKLGTGAWDKVKERINSRLKADKAAEAERNRIAYLEGNAEDQGAADWLASAWWRLFSGRTKDKMLANKKVEAKDILADAVEDVAMTLPLAPAKLAAKVGAAAAVPLASEIVDAIMYDVPEPNEKGEFDSEDIKNMNPNDLAERASFNPLDVAVGTVTNLAVPGLMNMAAKRVGNRLIGNGGKSAGMSDDLMKVIKDKKMRGEWKPKENPREAVAKVQKALLDAKEALENDAFRASKAERGMMQPEDWAVRKDQLKAAVEFLGSDKVQGNKKAVKQELKQVDKLLNAYVDVDMWGEYIDYDPVLKNNSIREQIHNVADGTQSAESVLRDIDHLEYNNEANDLFDGLYKPHFSTMAEENAAQAARQMDRRSNEILRISQEYKPWMQKGVEYFDKKDKAAYKALTPSEKILAGLESGNEELHRAVLASDASAADLFKLSNPKMYKSAQSVMDIGSTFAGNKAGNQSHAEKALAPVDSFLGTSLSKEAKKKQEAWKDTDRRNQSKAILESLAASSDNAEDRKWLKKLVEKPSIVKGFGEGNSREFRDWYLVRGQDILRGTDLFRSTPSVQ